jgi:hypothetical protein
MTPVKATLTVLLGLALLIEYLYLTSVWWWTPDRVTP